jgi:hypothetical protein
MDSVHRPEFQTTVNLKLIFLLTISRVDCVGVNQPPVTVRDFTLSFHFNYFYILAGLLMRGAIPVCWTGLQLGLDVGPRQHCLSRIRNQGNSQQKFCLNLPHEQQPTHVRCYATACWFHFHCNPTVRYYATTLQRFTRGVFSWSVHTQQSVAMQRMTQLCINQSGLQWVGPEPIKGSTMGRPQWCAKP